MRRRLALRVSQYGIVVRERQCTILTSQAYAPRSLLRPLFYNPALLHGAASLSTVCSTSMAVFTPVSDDDARELLKHYSLGELVSLRGITAGIENTNYFLATTRGEYVLTVFEVLTYEQLPFYIELMHHLAQKGIPVPDPQTRRNGERLGLLHGKPTAIVTRLSGGYEPDPSATHCALAGATLARTHLAGKSFDMQ